MGLTHAAPEQNADSAKRDTTGTRVEIVSTSRAPHAKSLGKTADIRTLDPFDDEAWIDLPAHGEAHPAEDAAEAHGEGLDEDALTRGELLDGLDGAELLDDAHPHDGEDLTRKRTRFALDVSEAERLLDEARRDEENAHLVEYASAAPAVDLYSEWLDLRTRALRILDAAENKADLRSATAAIRELRGLLDMPLKHQAAMRAAESSSGLDVASVAHTLREALEGHPEALQAVLARLTALASADATGRRSA